MKKDLTPAWLVEGAFSYYRNRTLFDLKVTATTLLLAILIFYSVGLNTGWIHSTSPLIDPVLFFILGFLSFLPYIIFVLFFIKTIRQKIGNSEKWQNQYLQTKIDRFNEYDKQLGTLIKEARDEAEERIQSIKTNWNTMKKNAEQAKELQSLV